MAYNIPEKSPCKRDVLLAAPFAGFKRDVASKKTGNQKRVKKDTRQNSRDFSLNTLTHSVPTLQKLTCQHAYFLSIVIGAVDNDRPGGGTNFWKVYPIFREKTNYQHFLKLYDQYIIPVADTLAWVLMANNFHVLVRIREGMVYKYTKADFEKASPEPAVRFEEMKWETVPVPQTLTGPPVGGRCQRFHQ